MDCESPEPPICELCHVPAIKGGHKVKHRVGPAVLDRVLCEACAAKGLPDEKWWWDCPACKEKGTYEELFEYIFGAFIWDIDKARKIIQSVPREPILLNLSSIEDALCEVLIYDEHLPHVDIAVPGIVGYVAYKDIKGSLLLDGHHRATRCLRENLPFKAHVLTNEESDSCLVRKPPKSLKRPSKVRSRESN